MDGQKCTILVLELVPKNLIFASKNPTQKLILQLILRLPFQQGKLERATSFVLHELFLGHFLNFQPKGKNFQVCHP